MGVKLDIVTCPQWNARKPKEGLTLVGKSKRIIFHHTAGHHREISKPLDESLAEAIRYAQDIQRSHMAPGGLGAKDGGKDSGHNFLITRAGQVLQGRWLTVSAIQAGHMVHSAHCPSQNDQIGIEHEHFGNEAMTPAQAHASATLMAWIAFHYDRDRVLPVFPHKQFFPTACPANLEGNIVGIVREAQKILTITRKAV